MSDTPPRAVAALEFRHIFDGAQPELTPDQLERASQAFVELFRTVPVLQVTSTSAGTMGGRVISNGTSWYEREFDDESYIEGEGHVDAVAHATADDLDGTTYSISLLAYGSGTEADDDDTPAPLLIELDYELDETGIVIRSDMSAESYEILMHGIKSNQVSEAIKTLSGAGELESTLGLNEQPVSVEEIQKLGELLMTMESTSVGHGD